MCVFDADEHFVGDILGGEFDRFLIIRPSIQDCQLSALFRQHIPKTYVKCSISTAQILIAGAESRRASRLLRFL